MLREDGKLGVRSYRPDAVSHRRAPGTDGVLREGDTNSGVTLVTPDGFKMLSALFPDVPGCAPGHARPRFAA
jgi:hypothetical protein